MSNTLSSKSQEQEALEQIETIIQSIEGTDSYIGMAMKGVLEIATSNINNDCLDSPVATAEGYRMKFLDESAKSHRTESRIEDLRIELKYVISERDNALCSVQQAQSDFKTLEAEYSSTYASICVEQQKNQSLHEQVQVSKQEVLALKAKLYDLGVGASKIDELKSC